jgi:hypothetical protein
VTVGSGNLALREDINRSSMSMLKSKIKALKIDTRRFRSS